MSRPIRLNVDLKAMRKNLRHTVDVAQPAKIMAVVKANAYGHGISRCFPALGAADALALLEIDSAVSLRQLGYKKPIVLLEGFFGELELAVFAKESLTAVVHHVEQIKMLLKTRLDNPIGIFLKANSGMNRLGLDLDVYDTNFQRLRSCANVSFIVAMTHFADADGARGVEWQYKRFKSLKCHQEKDLLTSMGNSATILRHPQSVGDWARPGIMLYGCSPFGVDLENRVPISPVMSLTSRIVARQEVEKGESVGYGCDYVAARRTKVGIVACGYGDGYHRNVCAGTHVLIGDHKAPIIGRISMDLLAIDITAVPERDYSKSVMMWGPDLPIEMIAKAAGTISYDLLCRVSQRVPVTVSGQ